MPRFDQEGHQLPSIAAFNFNGTPTYMVKVYASDGTYVDRGTSVLAWEQTSCCGLRTSFTERWQSSLTQALPARHVSRDATADRVIANGRFGSPPSRIRVRAHSSPTGENPIGSVRIRENTRGARHRFAGTVTCPDVLDGNVGILARAAAARGRHALDGGALIHLQDGDGADRLDVSMLSATDFARQQAVGCAPVTEPRIALGRGSVTVTDALP